jgi:hypothetical protein
MTQQQKLLTRIQALGDIHGDCAELYTRYNAYLVIPSICITSVASFASFLSTSSQVSEQMRSVFILSVGALTIMSSMMQTLTSSLKYHARIEGHQLAAEEYSKLLTKLHFEIINPNEENFFEDMEAKIIDIKNNCKYYPVQKITQKYKKYLSFDEREPLLNTV